MASEEQQEARPGWPGWQWRLPLMLALIAQQFWLMSLPGTWPMLVLLAELVVLIVYLHKRHGPFSFGRPGEQPDPEPPLWRRR